MHPLAPPTPEQLARAPRKLARYVLFESLGSGGFGSVYRAWDPQLNRWVAIKLLRKTSPRAQQRFLREIQSVARLRHPHVVEIHDAGQQGQDVFLVMEWVPGHTFEDLCMGGISPDRAAELLLEVADAVAHAHARQVWHRDLKPGNVLVDTAGHARVLDFGLAFLAGADSERLTATGLPLGTPSFMPPEQVHGHPTAQSDVWGLGALLYFALARRAPFDGAAQPMIAVQERLPDPPSEWGGPVPPALERICMRCLATEPAQRYAGPADVAEALRGYLRGPTLQPRAFPAWAAALLGAAALTGAAGLGVALASRRASPTDAAAPSPSPAASTPSPTVAATPARPAVDVRRALATARKAGRAQAPFEEISALLLEAHAAADGALREEVALELASLELRRGRLDAGIARLSAEPLVHAPRAAERLLAELRFQRDPSDPLALATVQAMLQGPPGPEHDTAAGLHAMLTGDQLGGLEKLREAARRHPQEPTPQLLLGRSLVMLGDVEGARRAAEAALALIPDDFRAYTILRDAAMRAGDAQASLAASDTLFELIGAEHVMWQHVLTRAQTYAALRRPEAQRRDLDRAIELAPHEVLPRLERAVFFLVQGDEGRARFDLQTAIRADPREVQAALAVVPPGLRARLEQLLR